MNDPLDLLIYNIIYSGFTKNAGSELFGKHHEYDNEVFMKSFAGSSFPQIWFELPLAGQPWYDLHVLTSRDAVSSETVIPEGIYYPGLFRWFSQSTGTKQLAISHDLSKGVTDAPGAQLLVNVRDTEVSRAFLTEAGDHSAADSYGFFAKKIPDDWFACYVGTFPGREDTELRVECIPDRRLQHAYAADAGLLRNDLARAGYKVSDDILDFIMFMSGQPFDMEFQFDVKDGGTADTVLGVSLRFLMPSGKYRHMSFSKENEKIKLLMRKLSGMAICDDRWRKLFECSFATRLAMGEEALHLGGYPAYLKIRMSCDGIIDAKIYLVAYVR